MIRVRSSSPASSTERSAEIRTRRPAPQVDSFELTPAKPVRSIRNPVPTFHSEFPNYFHTNDPVKAAQIKSKVNKAMESILRRLDLPYVIDKKTGEMSRMGFFQALEARVHSQDPGAKVMISGGVVRTLMAYIYKKVYNEHQRRSTSDTTEQVLDRIIGGMSRKLKETDLTESLIQLYPSDQDLPKLSALGIGSDLDISIQFSKDFPEKDKEAVKSEVAGFIDSAIDQIMPGADKKSVFNKSILPVGDAVEYEKQLQRSMHQGGSPLDWLAFPVSVKSGTQFVEGVPGTINNFLLGKVEYVSPVNAENRSELTIRMLRPLLEIPFLKASEETEKLLEFELTQLEARLKQGEKLNERMINEFNKMMRNARYEGAHNRFARPRPGDRIAELVKQISDLIQKQGKGMPVVPEYVRKEDIEKRNLTLEAQEATVHLMSSNQFRNEYTDKGTLYHGTPKMEYALAMMRNGLMPSIPGRQGSAVYGTGVYTDKGKTLPSEYAGNEGIVLELVVKQTEKLRVLNLEEFKQKNPDEYQRLIAKAQQAKMNINEYLAQQWQLDIIVNEYPLIMNPDAVILPKGMREFVSSKLSILSLRASLKNRQVQEYLNLVSLAKAFEIELHVADIHRQIVEYLTDKDSDVLCSAIEALGILNIKNESVIQQIAGFLSDPNSDVRRSAIETLVKLNVQVLSVHQQIVGRLTDKDSDIRRLAIEALVKLNVQVLSIHQQIVGRLTDSDLEVRRLAIEALVTLKIQDESVIQQIAGFLTDKDSEVLCSAIEALGILNIKNKSVIQQIAGFLTDKDSDVLCSAIKALGKLKVEDSGIHKQIAGFVSDQNSDVRSSAIEALVTLEVKAPVIHQQIAGFLSDQNLYVRSSALEALVRLKVKDPGIHHQIAWHLNDQNPSMHLSAIWALANLNVQNFYIHQQIAWRLTDLDLEVRRSAIEALLKLEVKDTVIHHQIASYLNNQNPSVRRSAIEALVKLNVQDLYIHQQIAWYLNDQNLYVRSSAFEALVKLNVQDPYIHQQIAWHLNNQNPGVRLSAIWALVNLNVQNFYIHQQIAWCLTNENSDVRRSAVEALVKLEVKDPWIHHQISGFLSDQNLDVRRSAIEALEKLQVKGG